MTCYLPADATPLASPPARRVPPDHFENGHRLRLAFDDDVAERPEDVSARELSSGSVTDDNPGPVLFVQRLEPRAEVHRVADDGVAHDRVRSDVAGDHRPGIDADADVERRQTPFRFPSLVQPLELVDHVERRLHRVVGVIGIVERRTEERHHHVADELVERALVEEHDRRPSS